jgi:hypothetical protein
MPNNKSKGKKPYECPVCKSQFTKLDSRHLDRNVHKAKLAELGIPKNEDPAISYFKPRKTSTTSNKEEQVENNYEKVGKNYEELFEWNINRHLKDSFSPELYMIHKIIRDIEDKKILVPRIQRNILWNRSKLKDLIISLYEGTPIGTLTFWTLSGDSKHVDQYRKILESKGEELDKHILLILDGLQRCSTIAAVFSTDNVVINEKFRDIDLYYNFVTDRFEFKEEIHNLDLTWINLKETYDSSEYSAKLKENYKIKIKPILDQVRNPDMRDEIIERITRIFSILGLKIETDAYTGQDLNFAHNLLVKRNLGTRISPLDLLYSVLSAIHPKSRIEIEKFSEFTKNTLGKRFQLTVHDILHLAIHLSNPGTYSSRRFSMSRINLETFAFKNIDKIISEITNNDTFKKFINILGDAIGALLPNGGSEIHQQFKESTKNQRSIITIFKKKSSFYACYCIYLFCDQYQQKKEVHQFLGKYFIYNILLERFSKREIDTMLDLRTLNNASKDFKSLRRKMTEELNPHFWTEILPQRFLDNKTLYSDLSMLYQLTLLQQPIFNATNITVKSFLFNPDIRSIGWIKIFHNSWFNKKTINPGSILNKILVNYANQSKTNLERAELWGWLKDILLDKEISYANGMFDSWNFPRGYEEEMEECSKNKKQNQIEDYFNDFFEKRAKEMAISIQKTFFLNGVN